MDKKNIEAKVTGVYTRMKKEIKENPMKTIAVALGAVSIYAYRRDIFAYLKSKWYGKIPEDPDREITV